MHVLLYVALFVIATLAVLLIMCEKRKHALTRENDVFSKRLSQLSVDSAMKVQVFTRLSTILSSSFNRSLLLPQIITDLSSFFPGKEIRIILEKENKSAVCVDKSKYHEDSGIPFLDVLAASNYSALSDAPLWKKLVDDQARLPCMYLFPLYVDEEINGYMLISAHEQIESWDYHFFSDISVILSSILQNILTVREKDFINEQFGKSVDPSVRDYLLTRKKEGSILPVSVLFFDIRNFTSLSEKIGPVQAVSLLNDIFSHCDDIIRNEGGFINKFTGDGFMAVFGAPEISEDHERHAVRAALSILQTVEIPCGMGIASGDAVAGTIGSSKRKEYTVIGDTVNTASRVESLCKLFGSSLLIEGSTMNKVRSEIQQSRFLGNIRLKGKAVPVSIFDLHSKEVCYTQSFTTAVDAYYQSQFTAALEQLSSLQHEYPDDKAINWFISRCVMRSASSEYWDGIELMTEK